MEFLDPNIEQYVESRTSAESDVLQELYRETHLNVLMPQMLSGHLQGRVLSMLSKMIRPKMILEIGTYTGYSALCLTEGLQEGGKLHTIDINEELEDMVRSYLNKANVNDKVQLHIGHAADVIPSIEGEPDIVFIDADKENYSRYYDLVIDRLKPGGYIIADNVLWSGKVLSPQDSDQETLGLVAYAQKVHNDPRVENVLFPVRDGLLIARKRD